MGYQPGIIYADGFDIPYYPFDLTQTDAELKPIFWDNVLVYSKETARKSLPVGSHPSSRSHPMEWALVKRIPFPDDPNIVYIAQLWFPYKCSPLDIKLPTISLWDGEPISGTLIFALITFDYNKWATVTSGQYSHTDGLLVLDYYDISWTFDNIRYHDGQYPYWFAVWLVFEKPTTASENIVSLFVLSPTGRYKISVSAIKTTKSELNLMIGAPTAVNMIDTDRYFRSYYGYSPYTCDNFILFAENVKNINNPSIFMMYAPSYVVTVPIKQTYPQDIYIEKWWTKDERLLVPKSRVINISPSIQRNIDYGFLNGHGYFLICNPLKSRQWTFVLKPRNFRHSSPFVPSVPFININPPSTSDNSMIVNYKVEVTDDIWGRL